MLQLKWMNRTVMLAVAAWVLMVAQSATAGKQIIYQNRVFELDGDTERVVWEEQNTFFFDGGKMRTWAGNPGSFDMIFDTRKRRILILDHVRKRFTQITYSRQTQKNASSNDSGGLRITADTGQAVMDMPTRRYLIYDDDRLVREIWATDNLDMDFNFMESMGHLEAAFSEAYGEDGELDEVGRIFRAVRGIPLVDMQYYPSSREEIRAVSVVEQEVAPEYFRPPREFKRMSFEKFLEE